MLKFKCDGIRLLSFNSYKFDDKLKDMPKFAIITNGTILNERLLKIIGTYISYITVSVDGNKDLMIIIAWIKQVMVRLTE